MTRFLLAFLALFIATPALAAPSAPLPTCGTTVVLSGDQHDWRPLGVKCPADAPIRYDAWDATFHSIYMLGVAGVLIEGGTVDGANTPNAYRGVAIDQSRDVTISYMTITRSSAGVGSTRSTNVKVIANRFRGVGSDCIDFASVQSGRVAFNQCSRAKMTGAEHPDGFQGITLPNYPPNNDISVDHNRFDGSMQGVFFMTGSAGRGIVVRENEMVVDFWNGVLVNNAADATITGNTVLPSAKAIADGVRPWVKANATTMRACGNAAPAAPSVSVGMAAC